MGRTYTIFHWDDVVHHYVFVFPSLAVEQCVFSANLERIENRRATFKINWEAMSSDIEIQTRFTLILSYNSLRSTESVWIKVLYWTPSLYHHHWCQCLCNDSKIQPGIYIRLYYMHQVDPKHPVEISSIPCKYIFITRFVKILM